MVINVLKILLVTSSLMFFPEVVKSESETQLTLSYDDPESTAMSSEHGPQKELPDVRVGLFYSQTKGIPSYGLGEDYFHSYLHDFPLFWQDADEYINSAKLPERFRFSGTMDTRSLIYH